MDMIRNIVMVAFGGALGSVCRYLLSMVVTNNAHGMSFPLGTFAVNILGCFLIGLLSQMSFAGSISDTTKLLLVTGFCGGFTTFSSYMMEAVSLSRAGDISIAMLYVVASIVLGFVAVFAGIYLARSASFV